MALVTPKVDIVFKKLFGVDENKDLLISLINAIVSEKDQVADITLLNPYNSQDFRNDKLSILDIKAKGVDGKRFNIEIQIMDQGDYDKRALYYWAKLYAEQLSAGEEYSNLSKTIGIHILNFKSITGDDERYHNCFTITEEETGERYFTDLEIHTIEMQKFEVGTKEIDGLLKKVRTSLDMWMAFLTRHNLLNKDKLPDLLNNQGLRKALTTLEVMNFSEEERLAYDDHCKWLMTEASALSKRYEDGKVEGREEGRVEGREEEKQKIALKMLSLGTNIDLISQITGLSAKEIEKLKS